MVTTFLGQLQSKDVKQVQGSLPPGIMNIHFCADSRVRDDQLLPAWHVIEPSLRRGESILIHCMAGVHRVPYASVPVICALTGCGVNEAAGRIGEARALEIHKMWSGGQGEDNFAWAEAAVRRMRLRAGAAAPIQGYSLFQRAAKCHAISEGVPLCQWRRGSRAPATVGTTYADIFL